MTNVAEAPPAGGSLASIEPDKLNGHDRRIVARALSEHATELEKLAKKAEDLGQEGAKASLLAERDRVLQIRNGFAEQTVLPLDQKKESDDDQDDESD